MGLNFSSSSSSSSSGPSGTSPTSTALTLKELRRIRVLDMANGGTIQDIPSPIPASQFLLGLHHKSPDFLLCDSASIRVGKRPCPVRSSALLAPGHLYLLLPLSAFQKRITPSAASPLSAALLLLLQDKHMSMQPKKMGARRGLDGRKRIMKRNRVAPSPAAAAAAAVSPDPTTITTVSHSNIVCDSDPDAVSRYIEQLIGRSNSWRPDLDAIAEIASYSSSSSGPMLASASANLLVHAKDDRIIPPAVPALTKASSRWPAERRHRVISAISETGF